jgi:hypothetical protein
MTREEKHLDYLTLEKSAAGRVQADTAEVKFSAVCLLQADSASFQASSTAAALAKGDVSMAWSSAQLVAAAKDVTMSNAGGQLIAAAGSVDVHTGGAALIAGGSVTVERGLVGVVLARTATLGDQTRVLLAPRAAAALSAGFGAGFLAAVACYWRRFRRAKP